MKKSAIILVLSALIGLNVHAQTTMQVVPVGNPGNSADTIGYGAVAYTYEIGKYEVTNSQYVEFLNSAAAADPYQLYLEDTGEDIFGGIVRTGSSGSYNYTSKPGYEDLPVLYITFWSAARFTNWINNGKGNASTETGSYTLGGVQSPANASVIRNNDATWVIANENEWYKAAYYDPTKDGNGGYWLYATQSDSLSNSGDFSASNGANYYDGYNANGGYSGPGATAAGTYSNATSYYGTYDQTGNASEWNEDQISSSARGLRGGAWSLSEYEAQSSFRYDGSPEQTDENTGFRLVKLVSNRAGNQNPSIPEPANVGTLVAILAFAACGAKRRKHVARN